MEPRCGTHRIHQRNSLILQELKSDSFSGGGKVHILAGRGGAAQESDCGHVLEPHLHLRSASCPYLPAHQLLLFGPWPNAWFLPYLEAIARLTRVVEQ